MKFLFDLRCGDCNQCSTGLRHVKFRVDVDNKIRRVAKN
jgi:hypothetical protein